MCTEPTQVDILPHLEQLCAICKSHSWPPLPFPCRYVQEPYSRYDTFLKLQNSADKGCRLCRPFWSCIINYSEITKKNIGKLIELSLSVRFEIWSSTDSSRHPEMSLDLKDKSHNKDDRMISVVQRNLDEKDLIKTVKARQIKRKLEGMK